MNLAGLNAATRSLQQSWLQHSGLQSIDEEVLGDEVVLPSEDGSWLLDQHLNAGWQYIKWGLKLQKEDAECVPADLVRNFMKILLKGPHDDATPEEVGQMVESQAGRKKVMQEMLKAKLTLVPIYCSDHWTLIVLKNTAEGKVVEYRGSLKVESAACRNYSSRFLQEISELELPARCNAAMQPTGTGQCGSFVLHWMEQACRNECKNEVHSSAGWPTNEVWGGRLKTLMKMLEKEQNKLKEDAKKQQDKDAAKKEKEKKQEEKKKKAGKVKDDVAVLADAATSALKAMCFTMFIHRLYV